MNENLQKALADLINGAIVSVDKAGGFIKAELPEYITQLLAWYGIYNFILFCIGILIFGLLVYGNWKQVKMLCQKDDDWFDEYGFALIANILQVFPIIGAGTLLNLQWLQIWIAPKVWLIEYAMKAVK